MLHYVYSSISVPPLPLFLYYVHLHLDPCAPVSMPLGLRNSPSLVTSSLSLGPHTLVFPYSAFKFPCPAPKLSISLCAPLFFGELLTDLKLLSHGPTILATDNKGVVDLAFDPVAFKKTKHILRATELARDLTIRRLWNFVGSRVNLTRLTF